MDLNLAAWMIDGGSSAERASDRRDRENLYAFRESQRVVQADRPSWFQRLRGILATGQADADLDCCPA